MKIKHLILALSTAALFNSSAQTFAAPVQIADYEGQGAPELGAYAVTTGGHIIVTFVSGGGFYSNFLYLRAPDSPYANNAPGDIGDNWIFQSDLSTPGASIDLGYFAPGTELEFHVVTDTHGDGLQNWYTGPGSRNVDNMIHAFVDYAYTGPYGGALVGFEGTYRLRDADYADIRYTFTTVSDNALPEPGSLVLMGAGLLGVSSLRRRKK